MAKLTDEEKKQRKAAHAAKYYKKHREREIKRVAKYYADNREKIAVKSREYNKNNAEKISIRNKNYRANLSEEKRNRMLKEKLIWAQNNPEKAKANAKKYRQKYPEKGRVRCLKRRARKLNATPSWLIGCEVERKRLHQIYLLSNLFQKADGIPRHVDHMWPLSDGGPHWSGNLQILSATENLKKHDKVCPIIKKQIQLNLEETKQDGDTDN